MLPFPSFMGLAGVDVSDPSTWTTVTQGGTSVINRANRSWVGKDDDGSGASELILPFSAIAGGLYRLNFVLSGGPVGIGAYDTNNNGYGYTNTTAPGPIQFDMRAPSAGLFKFDVAAGFTQATATSIRVELVN